MRLGFCLMALVIFLSPAQAAENPMGWTPSSDRITQPIPQSLPLNPKVIALGKKLFLETRISPVQVSCAQCHVLENYGMDGLPMSLGAKGQMAATNTPSVYNTAFHASHFWNGRAASLEKQVNGSLNNPKEMASNWDYVIAFLHKDPQYQKAFLEAFNTTATPDLVRTAIADFERSLLTPNSPFDLYLKGQSNAMSVQAIRGWETFQRMGCIACHQGIGLGGNLIQKLGIIGDPAQIIPLESPSDLGRFQITGLEADRYVFKVPSLRNVAKTAPYFHNGAIKTLREAVLIMSSVQLGISPSEEQVDDLLAFLESLTGELPE